jgi:hypothetical protein
MLDPVSSELKMMSETGDPKCVTALPRNYHGTFWPTDPKWNKKWGMKYLTGRYVTVANCKFGQRMYPENKIDSDKFNCEMSGSSKCEPVTREGQMWAKIDQKDCQIRNPMTGEFTEYTPDNVKKIKLVYKENDLLYEEIPQVRCAYKFQNRRTKMCLALFVTKGDNADGVYEYRTMTNPIFSDTRLIVGTAACNDNNVFWYKDREDSTVRKGDRGKVMSDLTIQQKNQMQMLDDKLQWQEKLGQMTVNNIEVNKTNRTSPALFPSDVTYAFETGDYVLVRGDWDECRLARVIHCKPAEKLKGTDVGQGRAPYTYGNGTNIMCTVEWTNRDPATQAAKLSQELKILEEKRLQKIQKKREEAKRAAAAAAAGGDADADADGDGDDDGDGNARDPTLPGGVLSQFGFLRHHTKANTFTPKPSKPQRFDVPMDRLSPADADWPRQSETWKVKTK